jgi:hypothetical protein
VVLALQLENISQAAIVADVVTAWVVGRGGTIRGRQQIRRSTPIAAGGKRAIDFVLRAAPVTAGDVIVLAVLEAEGSGLPWRPDPIRLEEQMKSVARR